MVNSVDFAARLEKIMEYYGLTASALAEEMDFNRSTISHLVSGRNKPSLEFVMKVLQRFTEVKLDWLVLGKGTFPSSENLKQHNTVSKPSDQKKPLDLFSEDIPTPEKNNGPIGGSKDIDRIVIFYLDGSFKSYEN